MKSSPALHTKPLSPDFPSLWDKWSKVITIVWKVAFGITLDVWQVELLRHVLEVYPPGHARAGELRYRSVLISMGRQNGKTEIMAVLGLIGLLRKRNALVIGIASSADQARLVFRRTLLAISSTSLKSRFARITNSRGIEGTNGTEYLIKPAKDAALQGLPVDLAAVDEVHLLDPALWTALINGMGSRANTLTVGITTAGDDSSKLLKDLYVTAQRAADGDPDLERFGAFIWEAPESRVPKDDTELLEYLRAANPSLASGRIDPELVLADVRAMPETDIIRYRLNRFTESVSTFLPLGLWGSATRDSTDPFPRGKRPVFSIDRTPEWSYASITASAPGDDGEVYTEVVASLNKPSQEDLIQTCLKLQAHSPLTFAMDSYALKGLGNELKKRGLPVTLLTQADTTSGAARFFALVQQGKVKHKGDPLLTVQLPHTKRKNVGENFRISRKDSSVEIDAVLSTMQGVYLADTLPQESSLQIF